MVTIDKTLETMHDLLWQGVGSTVLAHDLLTPYEYMTVTIPIAVGNIEELHTSLLEPLQELAHTHIPELLPLCDAIIIYEGYIPEQLPLRDAILIYEGKAEAERNHERITITLETTSIFTLIELLNPLCSLLGHYHNV